MEKQWYLYILRCADDTLYTGITTDVPRRVAAHNAGKGAKYTKGRRPVQVIYWETLPDHSAALRREREVKSFSRTEKLALGEGMALSSVDAERPGKEG